MYRDIGYYWLRLAIYVALAIGLATVFYDVGASYESIQVWERERERLNIFTIRNAISTTFSQQILSDKLLLIVIVGVKM